jgi:hypothetical protein
MSTTYEHPMSGPKSETVATLDDGRVLTINTQYAVVLPHGKHAANCDQVCKMGGRCNCGLLDGIDVAALVADARLRGKFGPAPVVPVAKSVTVADHTCPHCGTYCDGDCRA